MNVGCVPKKVLYNAALHVEMMHTLKDYGFISEF
jgi:glutathione reductase (NADPH)